MLIVLARLETVERTRSGSSNSEWLAASKRKFCRRCLNPWVFKFHRTSRRHFLLKSAEDIVPLTAQCAQIESLLRSVMVIFSGRQIIQSVTEVVSSPASSRALPSLERLLVPLSVVCNYGSAARIFRTDLESFFFGTLLCDFACVYRVASARHGRQTEGLSQRIESECGEYPTTTPAQTTNSTTA